MPAHSREACEMTTPISELKQLALAATQGEWKVGGYVEAMGQAIYSEHAHICYVLTPLPEGNVTREANAAYIAAANPQTILALIEENERLRKASAEWAVARTGECIHGIRVSESCLECAAILLAEGSVIQCRGTNTCTRPKKEFAGTVPTPRSASRHDGR